MPLRVKGEDLLHGDDVLFHAGDLRDADDSAGAVTHARDLHDDSDGGSDLLADGAFPEY